MMMQILIHPLTPREITLLDNPEALFLLDYRVLGESLDYDIPAMWKYENLLPWILQGQKVLVNEHASILDYPNHNHLFPVQTGESAKLSILERAAIDGILDSIAFDRLVALIPHPAIDRYAQKNNKTVSYQYSDFLLLNDKIAQKHLITDTPKWGRIKDSEELKKIANTSEIYLKRSLGSGGFTVFKGDEIKENEIFAQLFTETPKLWYREEKIFGNAMSIQLYKEGESVIIFGLSEQAIKEEKIFYGAKMLPLVLLAQNLFLKEKLLQCTRELVDGLLSDYEGFFGIDFIYDPKHQRFAFLEGNIRLTAMSIPTLLYNKEGKYPLFREDLAAEELLSSDLIVGIDRTNACYDVLRNV